MREICTSGSTRGETCAARPSHAPLLYQHCYWRSHPSSARRGMLRLIWSHPEFPRKEDIRDELRRSEIEAGDMNEKSFENILAVPKMNSPHSSRFIAVSKWPFQHESTTT